MKFTAAGGRVRLSTRDQDGHALVEVSDTGIGLSADEAARAFERS